MRIVSVMGGRRQSYRMLRRPAWLLAALAAMLVASAVYLHLRQSMMIALAGESLASDEAIGFPTTDADKAAQLQDLSFATDGFFSEPFLVLGDKAEAPSEVLVQERAARIADTALADLIAVDPDYRSWIDDFSLRSLWAAAPVMALRDDEARLVESLARTRERAPEDFRFGDTSGNNMDSGEKAGPNLVGLLWFFHRSTLPKLERLAASRQYLTARQLSETMRHAIEAFEITNSAVDDDTLRRLNVLYLVGVLFERPLDAMAHAEAVDVEIRDLRKMSGPDFAGEIEYAEAMDLPPVYAAIRDMSDYSGRPETGELSSSLADVLEKARNEPTPAEGDLARFLYVRSTFWLAWRSCHDETGPNANCALQRRQFHAALAEHRDAIVSPNLRRDLDIYDFEEGNW